MLNCEEPDNRVVIIHLYSVFSAHTRYQSYWESSLDERGNDDHHIWNFFWSGIRRNNIASGIKIPRVRNCKTHKKGKILFLSLTLSACRIFLLSANLTFLTGPFDISDSKLTVLDFRNLTFLSFFLPFFLSEIKCPERKSLLGWIRDEMSQGRQGTIFSVMIRRLGYYCYPLMDRKGPIDFFEPSDKRGLIWS